MKNFVFVVVATICVVVFDCRAEYFFCHLDKCASPQSNCFYNVKTVFSGGKRERAFLGNLVLMASNTVVRIDKGNFVMYPEVECCLRPLSAAGMKRLQTKEKWCCLYDITEYSSHERFDKVESCDCKACPISVYNDFCDCVKEDDGVGGLNGLLNELKNYHGMIFKSGLLALRDGGAANGRLLPITRSADDESVLVAYAIAVGDYSDKQIACRVSFGYEVFVIRGNAAISQGSGMSVWQIDLAKSKIVNISATGFGKVEAQINGSDISFELIRGSKSRRIQFSVEDVKDVLNHLE